MRTTAATGFALVLGALATLALPVAAQKPAAAPPATAPAPPAANATHFKNLKVLPADISESELQALMASFTRALGVRCEHCHVRTAGQPMRREDFPLDDKPAKRKAREMIAMVRDINQKYLAALPDRADPPIRVECVTCHHGTTEPRTLQAVVRAAYDQGGLDSARVRYRTLRDRYYGRFTYDFSEVPLADVGGALAAAGHPVDAESLHAWNMAMNPGSAFAKRQWASLAVANAFRRGAAEGDAAIALVRARNGAEAMNEEALNAVGYALLGRKENAAAIAVFERNAKDHPQSANAYDSLGEAYAEAGERKKAKDAYRKSLALDPKNENAKAKLKTL